MVLRWSAAPVRFSVGDSHSLFTFAGISRFVRLPAGPVTMHRAGRDGLRGFPLFGDGSGFWPESVLRVGDRVFLSFGSIDCHCHIARQREAGRAEEEIVSTLADAYINALLAAQKDGVIYSIVSALPPAPAVRLTRALIPPAGSDADRARYTVALNTALQERASAHGIPFLNVCSRYADTQGMLMHGLSDGRNHIRDTSHVRALLELLPG